MYEEVYLISINATDDTMTVHNIYSNISDNIQFQYFIQ